MSRSDSELIALSNTGNNSAFAELVQRYDKEVLTIAARFTNNSDDAKDIYQETFIRVFKGLSKFRQNSEFSTWLFRIATNVCLTRWESKKKERTVSLEKSDDEQIELAVSDNETDGQLRNREISEKINDALQHLSPQQRLVFILRHYHQHKINEIAERMNCAEGTVKKYLFEATQRLRTHLQDLYE